MRFYFDIEYRKEVKSMKNGVKKAMATFCLGAAVLSTTPMASWAETETTSVDLLQGQEIVPYMQYIEDYDCKLRIQGTTATVNCYVAGNVGSATKAKVIAELQVKSGSSWIPVEIWTVTKNNYTAQVNETYAIDSGKTYRVKATVTVWEGSQSETQVFFNK